MKRVENKILIEILTNIATLKAVHEDNSETIKEIKEMLIKQNGRLRDTEERSIGTEAQIRGIKWFIGAFSIIIAIVGLMIKGG